MIPGVEQQLAASLVTPLGTSYQGTGHHHSWQPQQSLHASNRFDRLQATREQMWRYQCKSILCNVRGLTVCAGVACGSLQSHGVAMRSLLL